MMERRRRRRFLNVLQTMNGLLPPMIVFTRWSILLVFLSVYVEGIMTFPEDSGVYSLFPDEDLKTGRKRFRFDEDSPSASVTRGQYREGREYSALVRSYPMLPHDRLHRPVDYSEQTYGTFRDRDRDRERHGRVYFDENFRTNRFEYHRLTPRPRPHDHDRYRPVSPIIFETSRRPPYRYHSAPPPVVGQSKLPPGAATRISSEDDIPTRIHIFDPESNSFGNPRNAGASTSGPPSPSSHERTKSPPSNFVETGPPGPESFLNHEEFLEYQKKIALSRFHDRDENKSGENSGGSGRKVLFESKEPFEIDGLAPPDKSAENQSSSGPLPTSPSSSSNSGSSSSASGVSAFKPIAVHHNHGQTTRIHDQRQHQRQREGHKNRGISGPSNLNQHFSQPDENNNSNEGGSGTNEERDFGGGEVVESEQNVKGEVVESENGKSEVTQLPPTHITKLSKKFTPSVKHDENVGRGTGFKLPMPTSYNQNRNRNHQLQSYSGSAGDDEEPPNLHGFVPVVPFHLIGAEPSRAISLERQQQQQQQRIVPVHGPTTTPTTSTTTRRPQTSTTTQRPPPRTALTHRSTPRGKTIVRNNDSGVRGDREVYSGFRPATEVSKSSSTSSIGTDENISSNSFGSGGSPASPILHASAGGRPMSETHSKVAITKQQELKRLQKQKQLVVVPVPTNNHNNQQQSPLTRGVLQAIGLFPQLQLINNGGGGGGDEEGSSSSSSSEPINHGTDASPVRDPTIQTSLDEQGATSTSQAILEHNHEHKETIKDILIQTSTSSSPPSSSDQNENKTSSHSHSTINLHSSSSSSHDHDDDTPQNNEIFDTRTKTILTPNGIRQGEFHLEGYMLNKEDNNGDGDGSSGSGSGGNRNSNSDLGYHHPHLHGPPLPYDYPDENEPKSPLSSRILLPGDEIITITPRDNLEDITITPSSRTEEAATPPSHKLDSFTDSRANNNDNHLHTGLYSSKTEPNSQLQLNPVLMDDGDHDDFHSGMDSNSGTSIPPAQQQEQRRTRFTHSNRNEDDDDEYGYNITPTTTIPFFDQDEDAKENEIILNDDEEDEPYFPYYKHYGNKINASRSTSYKSSSSSSSSRSSGRRNGKSELDPHSNGVILANEDNDFNVRENRLSGSYRHLGRYETDNDAVDVPLEVTLNFKDNGLPVEGNVDVELPSISSGSSAADDLEEFGGGDDNTNTDHDTPLFLESSETLINKTYYLDGNDDRNKSNENSILHDNHLKSMNFIKVTRIKAPSGPASKETSEKTSSTILARRTSKPAVIVSTTAAGARPRVVGSVVEAGPAWPGLVSNFIRGNNPSTGLTATVRPRGNSGTNPTHPATVIARQIQQVPQTEFRLPTPSSSSGQFLSHHAPSQRPNKVAVANVSTINSHPSPIAIQTNAKLIKQVIPPKQKSSNNHNDNNYSRLNNHTAFAITNSNSSKRIYSSEESSSSPYVSSPHIISNSSTGVVSMVHAHISHCPKLGSKAEIICDVHIREGHGIPNPQLTIGWRRKFYNSTKPDVLLALNKAPASGENGHFDPHHSVLEVEAGQQTAESLEDFHDKFNVTLAPSISPTLRSVLLIKSTTAPDTGAYRCEVNDGINILKSETLLFLCH